MTRWKIDYSAAELAFIKRHRAMPRRQLHEEFVQRFNRADVSLLNIKDICKRKRWLMGREYRFEAGHVPSHKGMHFGRLAIEKVYDGFAFVTSSHTSPSGHKTTRLVRKHRLLWEATHGPIPKDYKLKCLDGNKLNTDPSNWVCAPLGVLNRLRKRDFENAPPELKPTIMAVAKLEASICRKSGGEESGAKGNSEQQAP